MFCVSRRRKVGSWRTRSWQIHPVSTFPDHALKRLQSATVPVAMTTGRVLKAGQLLVIVARHRFLCDPLIFDRRSQNHAVGELIDHAALDLLPRRLTRRIMIAAV